MPARGAGAAVRTVRGSRKRRTATRATGSEGHTHWHARACGGEGRGVKFSSLVGPGRCGGVGQRRSCVQLRPRLV
jgi:hypothetical protein